MYLLSLLKLQPAVCRSHSLAHSTHRQNGSEIPDGGATVDVHSTSGASLVLYCVLPTGAGCCRQGAAQSELGAAHSVERQW